MGRICPMLERAHDFNGAIIHKGIAVNVCDYAMAHCDVC